jgi:hypothetical protein
MMRVLRGVWGVMVVEGKGCVIWTIFRVWE